MIKIPSDKNSIIIPHIKSKPHIMEGAIKMKCNVTVALGIADKIQ